MDGGSSDSLSRLSLRDYGRAAVTRYRNGGNGTLTCAPSEPGQLLMPLERKAMIQPRTVGHPDKPPEG